ncbi:MAG: CPBP family intramembrane metalloprotease [Bradymonadaceae bacterium]|nr:CPBP family intramembrane metalloprotease [Lujinxingiaceae bacterium]
MDRLSAPFVFVFYLIIVGLAFVLGNSLAGLDVLIWHDDNDTSVAFDALLGVGVGVVVVALSQVLDRTTRWARVLTDEFSKLLGSLSVTQAFIFAAASGIAEEIFFRGFLQQLLSVHVFSGASAPFLGLIVASLIFGGLHLGPDFKRFWPWMAMAIVLGGVFGWMYLYTGNVLAPIVAHFTTNFFNLLFMSPQPVTSAVELADEE